MNTSHPQASGLLGRRSECEALDRLLASVRAGQSRVLVLRGEAGVGKTALLEYLAERASGCRVARAAGVESEMELAFAGLHQLCAPMLDRLERLPGPAARCARHGVRAERRASRRTASWSGWRCSACCPRSPRSSRSSAWSTTRSGSIGSRRRRSRSSRAGCWRSRSRWCSRCVSRATTQSLAGLPELVVGGLSDGDARALLDSAIPGRLDERVRDRIVAETRGNPLALLELPRGLTRGGAGGRVRAVPTRSRWRARSSRASCGGSQSLPAETQRLLLAAAAEPVGDVTLLWRAAERLGIGADAAAPAEAAGLIELGARVRFRHPLVRSAAYRAAAPARPPGRCIARWPRRPIPSSIPIAERGIGPTRRSEPDEAVAARAGALGRPGAGPRRRRGGGRVPASGRPS